MEILDRQYDNKLQDANLRDKDWTEPVQFNKEYERLKPLFLTILKKYEFTWDGHLGLNNVMKGRIMPIPTEAPRILSAIFSADPRQRDLKREKIDRMLKASVVEPAVTE